MLDWSGFAGAGRALAALVFAGGLLTTMYAPVSAQEPGVGLRFPAPTGTEWHIIAGYNTVTHEGVDPYAIDLARVDGKTGGTALLSPISGRLGYVSDTCVSVRNDEVNILMCHVFADAGLDRGQDISVGQHLGTVAPDGEAENNGVAHIHLQMNARTEDRRGSQSGEPLPFTGDYRLEGRSLTRTSEPNAYYLERFVSTNDPSLARTNVDAGITRRVGPGEQVTLNATSTNASDFYWEQYEGESVALERIGSTITFVAPEGGTLRFRVTAYGSLGTASDTVRIDVGSVVGAVNAPGEIVAGSIPEQGVGLIVFGGGTSDELVEASGCTGPGAAFFATAGGAFIGFIPGAEVPLVNAAWNAQYPDGLPAGTPLLARCS